MLLKTVLVGAAMWMSSSTSLIANDAQDMVLPSRVNDEDVEEAIVEKPEQTLFEDRISTTFMNIFMWHTQTAVLVNLRALTDNSGGRLSNLPHEWIDALNSPGTQDCTTALRFLMIYLSVARNSAANRGLSDLDGVAHRLLAPDTERFRVSLEASLSKHRGMERVGVTLALLALDPDHESALEVLKRSFREGDVKIRERICETIGIMKLTSEATIELLVTGLEQREAAVVRQNAAIAVSRIGPPAAATVPGLIDLLKSGDDAIGEVSPVGYIVLPTRMNVALLALEKIGPKAGPALPVILKMLGESDDLQLRHDLLVALPKLGYTRESVEILERFLQDPDRITQITAACALSQLKPDHPKAIAFLKEALSQDEKKPRKDGSLDLEVIEFPHEGLNGRTERPTLKVLAKLPPQSKALVPELISLLRTGNVETIDSTCRVIEAMGPMAVDAVPALSALLGSKDTHNRAVWALSQIGPESVPVLVGFLKRSTFATHYEEFEPVLTACLALGHLGKDAEPAVELLSQSLHQPGNLNRPAAVIALGMLRETARNARPTLTKVAQGGNHLTRMSALFECIWKSENLGHSLAVELDREFEYQIRMFASWALTEIPE